MHAHDVDANAVWASATPVGAAVATAPDAPGVGAAAAAEEVHLQHLEYAQREIASLHEELGTAPTAAAVPPAAAAADDTSAHGATRGAFTLAELAQPGVVLAGVESSRKETYLSDDDFQTAMRKTREEFAGLPEWKKKQLKRSARLF